MQARRRAVFQPPVGCCFDWPKTEAVFIGENYLFVRGADTKSRGGGGEIRRGG